MRNRAVIPASIGGYKVTNPQAIFDGERWLIVDDIGKTVMQSDETKTRAENNAKFLQEHANRNNHQAKYRVIYW